MDQEDLDHTIKGKQFLVGEIEVVSQKQFLQELLAQRTIHL